MGEGRREEILVSMDKTSHYSLATEDVVMETALATLALGPETRELVLQRGQVCHLPLIDGRLLTGAVTTDHTI